MSGKPSGISENSRRIAKNTMALYVRMFILMIISLFTARIVLHALGVQDRGVYEAVGSFVSLMGIISSSFSSSISRFLTVEIGKGDHDALRKVFGNSKALILLIAVIVLLVAEPIGIWYVSHVMSLPPGRGTAAQWVFQFSIITFAFNLLCVPYTASIFAHERMSIYAWVGIAEGIFKLLIAIAIKYSTFDKLILYSLLLCSVSILVRLFYSIYCKHNFQESRAGIHWDREYFGKMVSFAGWNGVANGVFILNTQGVTQLLNIYFGVVHNTMRGLALNVENMVKQFISNVLTAFVPQITKSYASGNMNYCHELVCKSSKYAFLIGFSLSLPFFFEADALLHLWLGNTDVPEGTSLFTKLGLICMILDISLNPVSTYVNASGNIKKYYLMVSIVSAFVFPLTWLLYRLGMPSYTLYFSFIGVYLIMDGIKVFFSWKHYGFPIHKYIQEVILRLLPVITLSLLATFIFWRHFSAGIPRLLFVLAFGTFCTGIFSFLFALTKGERAFLIDKIRSRIL